MPMYLGVAVSDDYLQQLIEAYRAGQDAGGHRVEDGDQIVLDHLSANEVMSPRAPSAYELGKTGG